MKNYDTFLSFRVTPEDKAEFYDICDEKMLLPAEVIRRLMLNFIAENESRQNDNHHSYE
jgi:antitoxin component of RelBE/YafQ-DinJ toxin-antitoxin module